MRISIFGMGYVGAVSAACLADSGHLVIGVDVSQLKVDLINRGRSPVVEPQLEEILKRQTVSGNLVAITSVRDAVMRSDLSMICVGTPSKKNGDLDLHYVEAVSRQIGAALADLQRYHTVVVRSTVLPGTVRKVVIPILESVSGKKAGVDFGVAMNPEFLRESTAVKDFYEPPMTVIGELDTAAGDAVSAIYAHLPAPRIRRSLEVAESVKYACNAWHATKITFANEIGALAKAEGVDGREVMEIVCADKKLNISEYYMRPGFAFGGSCLPKDLRAVSSRAAALNVEATMLNSILRSNKQQIEKAVELLAGYGKRRIGMLGLSFKSDTDDLRESPLVELAEMLIGKGYELSIFDSSVDYARLHGANKDYITARIPHVSALLRSDIDDVIDASDTMVLGYRDHQFDQVLNGRGHGKKLVDLAGFMPKTSTASHQGVCW